MKTHHASKQQHGTRANDVVYHSVTSVNIRNIRPRRCRQPRLCAFAAIPRASGGAIAGQLCEPNSTREPGDRAVFDMRHIEHCCAVRTECVLCVSRVCDTDSCVAPASCDLLRAPACVAAVSVGLSPETACRSLDGRVTGPRRTQTTHRKPHAPRSQDARARAARIAICQSRGGAGRGAVSARPDVGGECI
jgi:hypothetical protein